MQIIFTVSLYFLYVLNIDGSNISNMAVYKYSDSIL